MSVGIPHYRKKIEAHYGNNNGFGFLKICDEANISFDFEHFGLVCEFEQPTKIDLYDDAYVLEDGPRALAETFGPLILRNVVGSPCDCGEGRKNIFPHLSFHIDRAQTHENQYTYLFRDPNDKEHIKPRTTSTVVLANIVAYLQTVKENQTAVKDIGRKALYDIFQSKDLTKAILCYGNPGTNQTARVRLSLSIIERHCMRATTLPAKAMQLARDIFTTKFSSMPFQ